MTKSLSPETIIVIKSTAPALQQHGVEITTRMYERLFVCLLYTSPSPRDRQKSRMPSSA